MKTSRFFAILALCFLFLPGVRADDDIPVSELPAKVTAAIEAKFKGATLLSAERETKNGRVVYEVDIRVGRDKKEIKVTEAGEILKVENDD
jgi:uncharacterized membrane protein YkoI